jgi:hypothetical protein
MTADDIPVGYQEITSNKLEVDGCEIYALKVPKGFDITSLKVRCLSLIYLYLL